MKAIVLRFKSSYTAIVMNNGLGTGVVVTSNTCHVRACEVWCSHILVSLPTHKQ